MMRIPGVPFLPGSSFRDTSKTDYRRSQKFMSLDGIQMLTDRLPTKGDPNYLSKYELPSLYPPNLDPKLPPWLIYDKKVLCFYGYFKESLPEVHLASYQVRKVKIYYYLEDGTIQVSEPRIENSGIPQGCLVSRQRIPCSSSSSSASHQNEFISVLDLNVNQTIRMFDRVYHITGCDLFTRNFLNRAGIPVPDPIEIPKDPSEEIRKKALGRLKQKKSIPESNDENNFEQFLKYDKKVLKFFGYWEDKTESGEFHNLEIYYYLADDTIEIKEIFHQNSGKHSSGILLKRGKLPKIWNGLPLPGELITHKPILNVLGSSFGSSRYLKDSVDTGKKSNYYKDCELLIGQHLNVYGREIILTNCDNFTKDYYHKKYGIEEFKPLSNPAIKHQLNSNELKYDEIELPPWNGWGTHEDSEQNCLAIEPKPPLFDLRKFLKFDRSVLRFNAIMLSKIKENTKRSFIISYYLTDDTIQVYELSDRNSGFINGEFFKRSKFFLPKQNLYIKKRPDYYKSYHLYIGGIINLRSYIFKIVSADEYTLSYMENHPYEFPYSNIEEIITKIRNALQPIYKNFISKYLNKISIINNYNTIKYDDMHKLLIDLLNNNVTEHEIITICRYFSIIKRSSSSSSPNSMDNNNNDDCKERNKIQSIVHWEIKRNLWNDLDHLKEYIYHIDNKKTGYISENKLYTIIIGCRLPFNKELINALLSILKRNDCNEIEINDFTQFIDIKNCNKNNLVEPIQPINIAFELCQKIPFTINGLIINWDKFLEKINLEKDLKNETFVGTKPKERNVTASF